MMLKRKPLAVVIGIVISSVIFTVIMCNIYCRLDQLVDWNATNAVASIAMAVLTLIAVIVAIYLPRKERLFSSKVELFDKRFDAYSMLSDFYWNTIVTGKPSIEDNNFHEIAVSRLRFLIDSEDWEKIQLLNKRIFSRLDFNIASNPNDFEHEFNELRMIFHKYLSFHDIDI